MTPPKPGSAKSRKMGCRCPREDNHRGKGRNGDSGRYGYIVVSACDVHRIPAMDVLLKACGVGDREIEG